MFADPFVSVGPFHSAARVIRGLCISNGGAPQSVPFGAHNRAAWAVRRAPPFAGPFEHTEIGFRLAQTRTGEG